MIDMPHWPKPLGHRPKDINLHRIQHLLTSLGNPEKKLPPVIHIAGTNGKGSTITFLKTILIQAGYKVHCYISPHLISFNERITIANQIISDTHLYDLLERCRFVVEKESIPITFFEGTTAAAILAFSEVAADFTLLETGMGGRFDATNIVHQPIITVITPISYDHTAHLGNTLTKIAFEKSGIMKDNCTCVISQQEKEAQKILEQQAIIHKTRVYRYGREWHCGKYDHKSMYFTTTEQTLYPLPSLRGDHQILNAGTAIAVSTVLHSRYNYEIYYQDVVRGLCSTIWPARLEHLTTGKIATALPQNWQIFLDGAHNTAGAQVLAEWAQGKYLYVILGMTRDKDTFSFLSILKPYIGLLCAVCVRSESRAQTATEIATIARSLNIPTQECGSLKDAIEFLKKIDEAVSKKVFVLICGSLFLAGDVLKYNKEQEQ